MEVNCLICAAKMLLIKCDDSFSVNIVCTISVISRIIIYFRECCLFLPLLVLVIQERTKDHLCTVELGLILQRAKHSWSRGLNHMLNFKQVNSPSEIGKTNYALKIKHALKCCFGSEPEYSEPCKADGPVTEFCFGSIHIQRKENNQQQQPQKTFLWVLSNWIQAKTLPFPPVYAAVLCAKGVIPPPWIKVYISIHLQ